MVCEFVWHTRYSVRHKQESRKVTAVKLADMADTDSVDSKEKQDVSVDNTCYMKLASKLRHLLVYMTTTIRPCVFCRAVQLCSTSFSALLQLKFSLILAREVANTTSNGFAYTHFAY